MLLQAKRAVFSLEFFYFRVNRSALARGFLKAATPLVIRLTEIMLLNIKSIDDTFVYLEQQLPTFSKDTILRLLIETDLGEITCEYNVQANQTRDQSLAELKKVVKVAIEGQGSIVHSRIFIKDRHTITKQQIAELLSWSSRIKFSLEVLPKPFAFASL